MAYRPRSLFWTLTASIVGVLVLTAILQILVAVAVVEPIARARLASQAEELIDTVAPDVERALADGDPGSLPRLLTRYQRLAEGMLLVFEPTEGPPVHPRLRGRRMRGPGPGPGDRRLPAANLPVILRHDVEVGGAVAGQLVVLRARPGLAVSHWLPLRWFFLFPVSLIAAALGGMWIFRRLQRRIGALQDHARAVGEGDLEARIAEPGDDELGLLGRQLNAMTENLAASRARVEAMESERKRMLADITHELTTPLTSVRGYAETLLDDVVSVDAGQRTRYLQDILQSSERMGLLIDDLLDLARLEAGASELVREPLDLAALVRNSVERQRPGFAAAGLGLVFSSPATEAWIDADGRRIEQVIDNLLANALRHVPSGGNVEVEVRVEGGSVVLEVRDDGPGFGDEALPHVFERFFRAEASRTTPGSGLGLAIVREIVLRHGGTVGAANRAAGGAALTVELPVRG